MHQPYYHIIPHSKKAIIFIHGFIGTPDHFTQFYPYINDEWSIYNILLDGHGGTVQQFANTSMKKWKKQVKEVIDEAKKEHEEIYLVGHSMGTLLSIEYSILFPSQIKGLFLLAIPLHVHITPLALTNAIGTILEINDQNNPQLKAAKAMYSVEPNKNFWQYIPWLPRYIELLQLCKWTRTMMTHLNIKTMAIQSKKDELVQFRSHKYLSNHDKIKLFILKNSTHYYYTYEDQQILYTAFKEFVD